MHLIIESENKSLIEKERKSLIFSIYLRLISINIIFHVYLLWKKGFSECNDCGQEMLDIALILK